MYAPSRHEGREPSTTGHLVGESSPTGAKLLERTWLGSTERRVGGSMYVFMKSSMALKRFAGNDVFTGLFVSCCGGGLGVGGGAGEVGCFKG